MQRKRRKGAASGATEDETSLASSGVAEAIVLVALHEHAVPVLAACLRAAPLEAEDQQKLLVKLLPPGVNLGGKLRWGVAAARCIYLGQRLAVPLHWKIFELLRKWSCQ